MIHSSSKMLQEIDKFLNKDIPIFSYEKAIKNTVQDSNLEWTELFDFPPLAQVVSQDQKTVCLNWLQLALSIHCIRKLLADSICIGFTGPKKVGKSFAQQKLWPSLSSEVFAGNSIWDKTVLSTMRELSHSPGINIIDFPGYDEEDPGIQHAKM
jgi:hypothetical protein